MDKKDFGKELLEKIKIKKLTPRSRWHFTAKRCAVWGVGIFSLIIGALTFSVIVYVLKFNDWDIYEEITDSFLGFIFLTLPYFWILFLLLFIFVAYYDLKHTKKGYRYSLPIVLAISIGSSVLLGSLFFKAGLGQAVDDVLGGNMPMYERFINPRIGFWTQPENGRLAGLVAKRLSEDEIIVLSKEMMEWDALLKDAEFPDDFQIIVGRPIRLIGEKMDDNMFRAVKILPVGPGRSFLMRHKRHILTHSCDNEADFCDNFGF